MFGITLTRYSGAHYGAGIRQAAEPSAALTGWQSLFMTVMYFE
jgi:hypothetical protein